MQRSSDQDRMPRTEGRAECAPEVRLCRKGHRMEYASVQGRAVCRVCQRRRGREKAEAKRRRQLEERRRRIAARRRPKRAECIWAAGHFEGEGTFSIMGAGTGRGPRPVASLSSTDKSMVDVFHEHWPGCLYVRTPRNPRVRKLFTWTLHGFDRLEGFVLDIRPYLKSERVRAKAALLLEDIRARAARHRTPEARAQAAERHLKMRELNRRGVEPRETGRIRPNLKHK